MKYRSLIPLAASFLFLTACAWQLEDISRAASDIPPPITRSQSETVAVNPDPSHTHADLAIWVDGQKIDLASDKYMLDEGSGLTAEQIAAQLKSLSDDACVYSGTCPERGEPSEENCVADPAIPCKAPAGTV